MDAIPFSLIEHGDKVKPGITLSYRTSLTAGFGAAADGERVLRALERGTIYHPTLGEPPGGTLLSGYEMKGPGILPTVFWTDERGLLLLVIAGMEAYCLTEAS
jgi:hypothetical protein